MATPYIAVLHRRPQLPVPEFQAGVLPTPGLPILQPDARAANADVSGARVERNELLVPELNRPVRVPEFQSRTLLIVPDNEELLLRRCYVAAADVGEAR